MASAARPVDPTRSLFWHLMPLYVLGVESFLQVLPGVAEGRRPAVRPQDRARRRYRGEPTAQEINAFERQGFRFLHERDFDETVRRFGADGYFSATS
ncbi:hypothetical protein AB0D04_07915 [Streptomyces sp. NPDC048483]|uniref:hypothetical protein n=1 Tax=Streptomyces sp. NPDC048483 TaxID=3154927 RepID=UPI003443E025